MNGKNGILARIDKDYIESDDDLSRSEVRWTVEKVKEQTWFNFDDIDWEAGPTRFRCKDDDGEVYYGGWLFNDPECIMQQIVLKWCMHDAGCTTIEVKDVNERWCQEIG